MTKDTDIEESFSYASYERTQDTAFLLSRQNSLTKSSTSVIFKLGKDNEKHDLKPDIAPRSRCVLACLYLMTTTFGMVVALGVIYVELIASFQCPRSVAALVQSLYMGLSLGGVLVSRIITKYDIGVCIMVSAGVAGVATAAGTFARDIYTVLVLVGVVAGLATAVILMAASVIVSWTFVSNRRFALSILSMGPALGQIILPYITDALIVEYQWDGCLLVISALTFLNCIPAGLVIYYSKQYFHIDNRNKTENHSSFHSVVTDSAFVVFMSTAFIFPAVGSVEQWFAVDLAVIKGFGIQAGATLLSLNGIIGFVARCIVSIILKCYPNTTPEVHICYNFVLWAVAHFGFVESNVYWEMVLAMVLRGYTAGAVTAFLPSLLIELRGPQNFPQTLSISYLLFGTGQILGGFLGGYSVDVTGSYNLIFYIATACYIYCGISMIIIYLIFKRRKGKGYFRIA